MILIPNGCYPVIAQQYGNKSNNAWYASINVHFPFHNGTDISIKKIGGTHQENQIATYGCKIIAWEEMERDKIFFDGPMNSKGNGIQVWGKAYMEDGILKRIYWVFWHNSQVATLQHKFKKGDVLCNMGNSGLVFPTPTDSEPYNGGHVHIMAFMFHNGVLQNADNGVGGAIDPMQFINFGVYDTGGNWQDTNDLFPIQWIMGRLVEKILLLKGR